MISRIPTALAGTYNISSIGEAVNQCADVQTYSLQLLRHLQHYSPMSAAFLSLITIGGAHAEQQILDILKQVVRYLYLARQRLTPTAAGACFFVR